MLIAQLDEPGTGGIGGYVAQGAIVLFLVLLVVIFARTAFMFSMLLWEPIMRLVRRRTPPESDPPSDAHDP